jgi:hypothetical protein
MSNRKLNLQGFFRKSGSLYRKITRTFVNRFLRYTLLYQRQGKLSTAGFILPTTVLLILVVALTVGALTFRAYNRNIQVIGEAQQRVIYNAATPAIDRARSKLEFLFDPTKDTRLPSGVPAQGVLEAMLLNNGTDRNGGNFGTLLLKDKDGNPTIDPYTFPDETRILKNGKAQNIWAFQTDTDGDGKIDKTKDSTVVYSIIVNTPPATPGTSSNPAGEKIATRLLKMEDKDKAKDMYVRQAPLSVDGALGCSVSDLSGRASGPDGWFDDKATTAILRKNFQVDALVIPGNSQGTKATLEFTQDRQMNRGNKWGAWFRHDLEIYPGEQFNWNGAMHTEGSLIIGGDKFDAFLISAPASCLYYPDSSEITVTDITPKPGETGNRNLLGLVSAGIVKNGSTQGTTAADIHLHSDTPTNTNTWATLNSTTGSSAVVDPIQISIDPEVVLLEDGYTNLAPAAGATKNDRNNRGEHLNANGKNPPAFGQTKDTPPKKLDQRIYASAQTAPYVDDLYRADDRWGPKPKYAKKVVPAGQFGKPIPSADNDDLLKLIPDDADKEAANVGLDGYWERRARAVGMRVLVGQRLELGNLFTWYAPEDKNGDGYVGNTNKFIDQKAYEHEGDPLYPATVKPYPVASATAQVSHIDLHRRTLRDNLSAVQSTAVYHSALEKDYPVACIATTAHPGTLLTLRQSLIFEPFNFKGTDSANNTIDGSLLTNFFTGVGTNGWEFETPGGTASEFETQIRNSNSPLRKALENLANFAGDYNPNKMVGGSPATGAFPPTLNDDVVHPYPKLSMWGNYSELKRALAEIDTKTYDKLSIADKAYIQTAACTIGMLAYNIDEIQKFDPSNKANDVLLPGSRTLMSRLAQDLWNLMDGEVAPGNPEVLPRERLRTYGYSNTGTNAQADYRIKDYQSVPPEAYIAALRAYLLSSGFAPDSQRFMDEMRLAEMIMLHHQIRRDRTFGFSPSPRFGEYGVMAPNTAPDPDVSTNDQTLPVACDPDQFVFLQEDSQLNSGQGSGMDTLINIVEKPSTVLNASGLVSNPDADDFPRYTYASDGKTFDKSLLSRHRLALSRLCGTMSEDGTRVLPKFPALYYLFPEVDHDHNGDATTGGYNHTQPLNEPYIGNGESGASQAQDTYIASMAPTFKRVSDDTALGREGHPSVLFSPTPSGSSLSRRPGTERVFPVADYSVKAVALQPRPLNQWKLPHLDSSKVRPFDPTVANTRANFSTNLVLIPKSGNTNELDRIAVPFLDRAFLDGRQLMLTRTLDIDLGMLRGTRVADKKDTWLPLSGIIYAFREDAVREDAIARPSCGTDCRMNLRNPANPVDPPLRPNANGITTKPIDEYPDPGRRVHGFRLRNGVQLKRNKEFEGVIVDAVENVRGLSFFTDQPVYIHGDFNLHQDGLDDTIGTPLEEFTQLLPPTAVYNAQQFYTNRTTRDDKFAKPESDRWRPSEILADSVSILSSNFCDGTISDMFVQFQGTSITTSGFTKAYPVPDFTNLLRFSEPTASANRSYYHQPAQGLFDPGCLNANFTSFHNHNRPAANLGNPDANGGNKVVGTRDSGWDWVRENSRYNATAPRRTSSANYAESYWVDFASPVKISRAGQPLVARPRDATGTPRDLSNDTTKEVFPSQTSTIRRDDLLPPIPYNVAFSTRTYFDYGEGSGPGANEDRKKVLITAASSRVNSIIVSGISPSRPNQGYGGLHNFPRFLENWDNRNLNFAGSFIQLQYTNYATAPFELENLEPSAGDNPSDENIVYYHPPRRLWGYDVALQFSTAGPAAARFVTSSKNRSEYYVEPPANDPYITTLCDAAKEALSLSTNCPR